MEISPVSIIQVHLIIFGLSLLARQTGRLDDLISRERERGCSSVITFHRVNPGLDDSTDFTRAECPSDPFDHGSSEILPETC